MKTTTFLLALVGFTATAIAATPSPSNTHIQINNAPDPITKSRVSVHLTRHPRLADKNARDASSHLANAVRDASADAVAAQSGTEGISRRGSRVEKKQARPTDNAKTKRAAGEETEGISRRGSRVEKRQARLTDNAKTKRAAGEMKTERSETGKARRQRREVQRQQRREPKVLPRVSRS